VTTLLLSTSLQQNHRKRLWQLLSPFFTIKPLKKVMETTVVFFFFSRRLSLPSHYNTTIKESNSNSYCRSFLFCNTTIEESDNSNCHCLFLLYNTTIEEDDGALLFSPFSETQRRRQR
jgi:hypothetical protein